MSDDDGLTLYECPDCGGHLHVSGLSKERLRHTDASGIYDKEAEEECGPIHRSRVEGA